MPSPQDKGTSVAPATLCILWTISWGLILLGVWLQLWQTSTPFDHLGLPAEMVEPHSRGARNEPWAIKCIYPPQPFENCGHGYTQTLYPDPNWDEACFQNSFIILRKRLSHIECCIWTTNWNNNLELGVSRVVVWFSRCSHYCVGTKILNILLNCCCC